jgi:hypothetical protein
MWRYYYAIKEGSLRIRKGGDDANVFQVTKVNSV